MAEAENKKMKEYVDSYNSIMEYASDEEKESIKTAYLNLMKNGAEIYEGEEFFLRGKEFESLIKNISEKHLNLKTKQYEKYYQEPLPEVPVLSFMTKKAFTGTNIDRADSFRRKLIELNLLQKDEPLYLITEKQAEMIGTKIKNLEQNIEILCPPNNEHVDYYKQIYYPITNVENINSIKAFAKETDIELPETIQKIINVPDFAMITNEGLKQFNNYTVAGFNKDNKTYILSNGNDSITLPEETVISLSNQQFNEVKIDSKTYKNVIEAQYNDFFKFRLPNDAQNFEHNFSVLCRTQATSPLDCLKIAKDLVNTFIPAEKNKFLNYLDKTVKRNNNKNRNEYFLNLFYKAHEVIPLNEDYFKENDPDNLIVRKKEDFVHNDGEFISSKSKLKIGDNIKNVSLKAWDINKNKQIIYKNMTILSSSEKNNLVILKDDKNYLYELPLDKIVSKYSYQAYRPTNKHRNINKSIER
jgi:hypothetical protein